MFPPVIGVQIEFADIGSLMPEFERREVSIVNVIGMCSSNVELESEESSEIPVYIYIVNIKQNKNYFSNLLLPYHL